MTDRVSAEALESSGAEGGSLGGGGSVSSRRTNVSLNTSSNLLSIVEGDEYGKKSSKKTRKMVDSRGRVIIQL